MPPEKFSFALFAVALLALPGPEARSQDEFLKKLDPFLSEHCLECHDDLSSEGDLDLTDLVFDPSNPINFDIWDLVFQRVKGGEMPPKEEPKPKSTAKSQFLKTLMAPLVAADQADLRKYGRVHGRRLTRVEYEHTLHDLLGIDTPLATLLPADAASHGFETMADAQQLSHFHLDKYLTAADTALNDAFQRVIKGDRTFKAIYGPKELTAKTGGNYRGPEARNGKVISWPIGIQFYGRMPKTKVPESGWYRITIKNLHGINRGPDNVVWGSLRSGAAASNAPMLYYVASVEGGEKPRNFVCEAWIQKGHLLEFKPNEGPDKKAPTGGKGGNVSYQGRDLAKQGFSGLVFDSIGMERIYPNGRRWEVRSKLFPGLKFKDGKPVIEDPAAELNRMITAFAHRAFRRPVSKEQVAPYRQLGMETLAEGGKLPEALRVAYRAILCSPRFLTFVESPGRLDGNALASRLSYLLWDSLPDRDLRVAASEGKLSDPKALAAQVNRMLRDSKSDRFIASFTDQWLNLKEIDFTTPDPRRFREFDPIVQDSMVRETRAFVAELFRENLSVRNFLRSDFSMTNTRLKAFYRMKDVSVEAGRGLQKIGLPEFGRSGLMTQGSILKVTADGNVTSPILRGIWINERILGKETPPPPPNVPAVEPDIRGATSIRDQLAKHSTDPSCAACHAKIDPAGFALENFDPTGQWRKAYGTARNAAKVDPSGVTPEGEPFKNIMEWKQIHLRQPDLLARAFAKQLLAYGTGGPMRFSDGGHLDRIVAAAREDDYGLRTILQAAVASPIFQNK